MRATSKHLQIQGRSAKHIFILQMPRNIVSLFKRFGRRVFQSRTSTSCKTFCNILTKKKRKMKKILIFALIFNHLLCKAQEFDKISISKTDTSELYINDGNSTELFYYKYLPAVRNVLIYE